VNFIHELNFGHVGQFGHPLDMNNKSDTVFGQSSKTNGW